MKGIRITGGDVPPDLLKLLTGEDSEPEVKKQYDDETATIILNNAFDALKAVQTFQPGDIIKRKSGLDDVIKEYGSNLLCFVGYDRVEMPADAGLPVVNQKTDGIAMFILPKSGACVEYRIDTRYYNLVSRRTA